jgi:regulator of replication initiation timing
MQNKYFTPVIFLSVISILMAFSVAILLRKMFENNHQVSRMVEETKQVNRDKVLLLNQLEELDAAFKGLISENHEMGDQINSRLMEIVELRRQINAETSAGQIDHFRSRVSDLEVQLSDYNTQLEELLTYNHTLMSENAQIRFALEQTTAVKNDFEMKIEQLQQKVQQASVLRITSLEVVPLRNSNGKKTNKARRTNMIRFNFVVNENPFAEAGDADFYFLVTGPGNSLLNSANPGVFEYNGEAFPYSYRHTISFQNFEKPTHAEFALDSFPKGIYRVNIYNRQTQVGNIRFELN